MIEYECDVYKWRQRGRNMTLLPTEKKISFGRDLRIKEEAKSEGHESELEEEEEREIKLATSDDANSNLSSIPSETGDEAVVAKIKSKNVNTN